MPCLLKFQIGTKKAQISRLSGISDPETALFDYCVRMSKEWPSSSEEWMKRAEQVANGKVTDHFFAVWLNRRSDHEEFGELAKTLAKEYFSADKSNELV